MLHRTIRILDILSSNRDIKVTLLAEILAISQVTLRKDLDNLEKRGFVHRVNGYVTLDGSDEICKRMAFFHSIKLRIAKQAAQIVEEGETILLESGSCCALFAEELALMRKNVTIITNSVFIARYVCKQPGIKIILLGGYLQPESQVLVGTMTTKYTETIFLDKFFLGTDGFIPGKAFTGSNYLHVETVLGLAKHVKNVFVLTESAKFQRCGVFNLIQLDRVTGVFTDDSIPKEAETSLLKNNVQLYKVPAVEEKIKWRQFPGHTPILYVEKE
ncbi:MAG: DeoR/GlpR family DNA-binding transcription regulator [Treponema sp.]|nr:DeoR/GlpR family DNA-binding transcription regulator [Treponema sp.]